MAFLGFAVLAFVIYRIVVPHRNSPQ